MYLQEILEVGIGLVFMWLVLSIAAMSVQEWIGNIFKWRANTLETTIGQMLGSPNLTQQLYAHPLISSLYPAAKKPGKKPRHPSYIPANKFALALFDILIKIGVEASPIQNLTTQINARLASLNNPNLQKLAQDDWTGVVETAKQINASTAGSGSLDSLKMKIQEYAGKYPEVQDVVEMNMPQLDNYYNQFVNEKQNTASAGAVQQQGMSSLRLGIAAVESESAKLKESLSAVLRSMETYVAHPEQSLGTARIGVENWFNDCMDRLTGTYKRKTQIVALLIGFVLAVVLNVDSVYIATSLWREPTLRQAIIAEAQTSSQQNLQAGSTTAAATTSASASPQTIPQLQAQLQALNIPFGWSTAPVKNAGKPCSIIPFVHNTLWGISSKDSQGNATCKQISNVPYDLGGWLTKLLGFAITAAATAQGAPFWFDILSKFINVRSSGTNPDEKQAVG